MSLRTWAELVVLSVLWGGTFIFVKIALPSLPPLTLTLVRCAVGAATLLPIVLVMGLSWPRGGRMWRDFAVMALLNNVIPFGLIFWGQTYISAGLTGVMNATTPLMTLLVARFVAGEPLAGHKVAGLLIGLAGVALLVGPSALAGDGATAAGMLLVTGGALSYGFSALWGRRFKEVPPVVSAAAQLFCSTVILLPLASGWDQFWRLPIPLLHVWGALLALGMLSTAAAYVLFFRIMATAGSNNVMLVTLLIPVSAVGLGALVFGERLSPNQIAGSAVIALSLLVIDGRLFGFGAKPIKAVSRT